MAYASRVYMPISDSMEPEEGAQEEVAPKNLYVLNLPLYVTTVQLENLFRAYGTVRHCVILSMLDGQARRRGFVDMDTAQEAQDAMQGVHGHVWHGYPLEVSYARVQRSEKPEAPRAPIGACARLVLHGLLPCATIDGEDVREMVAPHAAVTRVDFPAHVQGNELFSVGVTLADPTAAERVFRALHGQEILGQHVRVTCEEGD